MLEWYRVGMNYHDLMDEVAALVRFCGQGKFDHWTVEKLSYAFEYVTQGEDLELFGQKTFSFNATPQELRAFFPQLNDFVRENLRQIDARSEEAPDKRRSLITWFMCPEPKGPAS